MNCSNCGQLVATGVRFCGGCGQALSGTPPSSNRQIYGSAQTVAAIAGAGTAPPPGAGIAGAPSFMQGLLARIRGILLSPKQEWPVIAEEPTPAMTVFQQYVLPLLAFVAVISFVHVSVVGVSVPFAGTIRSPIMSGLTNALLTLVMGAIGICIVAAIINALAPKFGGVKEWRQAMKAAAYSLTPAFVGSVFGLLPSLGTLLGFLAGVYGIYVLYLGLPVVMRSQQERAGAYTAWVVVCTIVVGLILGIVSTTVGIGSGRLLSGITPAAMSEEAERQQGAEVAAQILGGALGTDDKGKAGLATALSNLAKAGEQMEKARSSGSATSAATAAAATSSSGSAAGDPAQNAIGAAGGLLSALGGALGGENPKQPVHFHQLQEALPASAAGLARTNLEGGAKEAMGIKGSTAKATYGTASGSPRIQIEVSDMTGISGLMELASSMQINETRESDSGYERDVTLGGRTAHVKFDRVAKHGEVSAIVASRFSVEVRGDEVSMEELEKVFSDVDLAALESMKNHGTQN